MKVGIIFKKAFQEDFGEKKEFIGKEITLIQEINKGETYINIQIYSNEGNRAQSKWFNTSVIQLLYLGDWK